MDYTIYIFIIRNDCIFMAEIFITKKKLNATKMKIVRLHSEYTRNWRN